MLFKTCAALAVSFSLGVNAFFPYLTPAHTGAQRKIHISDSIAQGWGLRDSETPLTGHSGITKATLRKRSHPKLNKRGTLTKRNNDFKYETDSTLSQPTSAAMDQDGTDTSYFAEVTVGTDPGEKLLLLMDTGSSALWVMGQGCTSSACQIHNLYGSSSSKTMTQDSGSFNISYQSGAVAGDMVSDQVSFAGMNINMEFGMASEASDDFNTYAMDGIMGLARSAAATDFSATPFIEVVKQAKALKANIFGVWLDRATDNDKNGEINFGAPDPTRYTGGLNYIDTNDSNMNMWQIPVDDAELNGNSLGFSGKQAVLDTGTTLMFVPPADAETIFKGIDNAVLPSGQDIYQIPCDTTANLSVVFNNVPYSISPKDFVGGPVSGSQGTCYAHVVAIAAVNGDSNTWLLGDTFLKNVYSVFDADQNRIGLGTPSPSADQAMANSSPSSSAASSGTTESPLLPNEQAGSSVATTAGAQATGGSGKDNGDAMSSIGGDAPAGPRGASAFGLAMAVGVLCMLW